MPREKVIVRSSFPKFARAMREAVKDGVEAGSVAGARASAAAAPVGDGREGVLHGSHLRDTYDVVRPGPGKRGWTGGYGSHDPNAVWQELGTFGRRVRKHKRQSSTQEARRVDLRSSGGRSVGIRARRIMSRAARPALASTIAGIRAAFPRRRFL